MLIVNKQTGTWSYSVKSSGWGLINTAPAIKLGDGQIISAHGQQPDEISANQPKHAGGWRISWLDAATGLRITQTLSPSKSEDALMVATEITNTGRKPLALAEVRAIEVGNAPDSHLALKGEWRHCSFYVESNMSSWAGVKRLNSFTDPIKVKPAEQQGTIQYGKIEEGVQESWGGVGLIHDPEANLAFCCSTLSWKRTLTVIRLEVGLDGPKQFAAISPFGGLEIAPGATVQTEPLWLAIDSNPFDLLERYGDAAGAHSQARIWPNSPMGFMSWYATRTQGGVDLVLRNADFVMQRFAGYPFEYCHWGHGWQWKNALGKWEANEEKNPNGLAWLTSELRKRGLELGLFCPFFCVTEEAPLYHEHPNWFIKDPKTGEHYGTEFAIWDGAPNRIAYFLDPTHPEVQKFALETVRRIKRDGCKFWLFDFGAPFPSDGIYHDKTKVPGQECLRLAYDYILPELDENDFVYLCSCPTMSFVGQAHCINGVSDIGGPGSAFGEDFQSNMSTLAARWYAHRRLWVGQPDALIVGLPGTIGEARIRASFVALCGGVFFLSEDLPSVPEERLVLAEKVMPPHGQAARPIDLFSRPYPEGYPQIWHLSVQTDWDNWQIVGLMNAEPNEARLKVDFKELGLEPQRDYLVREFWTGEALGRVRDGMELVVPGKDARVLSIRAIKPHPWVAGTDMHITQGAMEIKQAEWDENTLTLKLDLKRRAGAKGKIFIAVPKGYSAKTGVAENGYLTLDVDFQTAEISRQVQFKLES